MTIQYCDFCGDKIPANEGDPITLGNPCSTPGARKDACTICYGILWAFAKHKTLRPIGTKTEQRKAESE